MIFEKGDLVKGDYPIFCHQVNCKGVMGAGIAKQIKIAYPEVFQKYLDHCHWQRYPLGTILPVETKDGRLCLNMFAQDGFGSGQVYTNYDAFKYCLNDISEYLKLHKDKVLQLYGNKICFPYNIGCGNAGGDWRIVLKLIKEFEQQVCNPYNVKIIQLDK